MYKKILKIGIIGLVLGSSLFAKESKAIKDLDVSGVASLNSNMVWRGKTWTDNSANSFVGVTLDYKKGAYLFVDQYAAATVGLGMDLSVGWYKELGNYKYDIGYINYGWMNDSSSPISFNVGDELYLKNTYNISSDTSATFSIFQSFLGGKNTTLETNIGSGIKDMISGSIDLGATIDDSAKNDNIYYAQLNLSKPCMITGGAWKGYIGWETGDKKTVYGISHEFSF